MLYTTGENEKRVRFDESQLRQDEATDRGRMLIGITSIKQIWQWYW